MNRRAKFQRLRIPGGFLEDCRRLCPTGSSCVSAPLPSIAAANPRRPRAPGGGISSPTPCSSFSSISRTRTFSLSLSLHRKLETLTLRFSGYRRRLRPPQASASSLKASPLRPLRAGHRNRTRGAVYRRHRSRHRRRAAAAITAVASSSDHHCSRRLALRVAGGLAHLKECFNRSFSS